MRVRPRRGGVVGLSVAAAAAVLGGLLVPAPASAATSGNLLTLDQATVEGSASAAGFSNGYRASLARSTAVAAEGVASLALTATATRGMAARTAGGVPVAPGTSVTASAEVRADISLASPSKGMVQLRYWTATGASAGTVNGPWTALSTSTWSRLTRGASTVPSAAASVSVFVVIQNSSIGDRYFADKWGLWSGTSVPTWAPPTTAPPAPDTTPPSTVTGVVATADTSTGRIAVQWAAATDDVAVTAYRVFLSPAPGTGTSGAPSATTSSTSWTSGTLSPGDYAVQVVAVDAAGNASTPSGSVTTTLASPPPPPPPPPSGSNLLTTNQADVEASTLGFEISYGGISLARTTSDAAHGTASLSITATTAATFAVRTARTWTAVTGGSPYAAALSVRTGGQVAAGHKVLAQVRSYDASGTQVGVGNGPWTTVGSSAWTRVSAVSTMPATAVRASVHLVVDTALVGDSYLADTWGFWQSSTVPAWSLPPAGSATVTVFLGDSYSAGTGASSPSRRWTSLVSGQRGWLEANYARGGTGYLKTSSTNGCGLAYCPTFREMANDAVAAQPDIVVVAGGRNDLGLVGSDPATVHQAVLDTYATLRQGLPNARIYAITPMWDASTPPASLQTLRTWVIEAAAAHGVTLIDNADTWLIGHPEWITSDAVHPNDDGHAQLAQRVVAALG